MSDLPQMGLSGRTKKPLTDEMWRILWAIHQGRVDQNQAGRYVIAGDARPDRRSRELLRKRGYIDQSWDSTTARYALYVTDAGIDLIKEVQRD